MSPNFERSVLRIVSVVALAALLCLTLPRALSAMEGSSSTTEGSANGAAQAPSIGDIGDVASWAESCVAAAVYKGWIPERYRIYPNEEATREFAATLLACAFPDPTAYTGLAITVCAPNFKRSMSIQIVADGEPVYPSQDGLHSIAFTGSPGIASYCSSLEEAKQRRVGSNPLVRIIHEKGE